MNGAELLLETLVKNGVEICFANPGTSEMQLVAAIGETDEMRAVLCLFEGVVTGAADGYGRMSDRPAATLLHLGSGYSNSMANLHNARRAHVPLLNIVGEHATWHLELDAPLTSDLPGHARLCSAWTGAPASANDMARAGAEAVQASLQGAGKIATLIVPANHAWDPADEPDPEDKTGKATGPGPVCDESIRIAGEQLLNGKNSALFLGGRALREDALALAGRIARKSGCRLVCETFTTRLQRGAGRVPVERLQYFGEQASAQLEGLEQVILVGAVEPVSFFAYPGKQGRLLPESCDRLQLASVDQDAIAALTSLATLIGADEAAETVPLREEADPPAGPLTPVAIGMSLRQLMPEGAIVSDEAATCGLALFPTTADARPHDWLMLTGGAIGQGLPLSLGAALACPDRKVIALQADGSAMYTVQALWSMAREQTDVTVIILNNSSYAILNIEMARVGAANPTPKALSMLDLSNPHLDWVAMANSMGVPASRAEDAATFHEQLRDALNSEGPHLIDAVVLQEMPA